MSVMSNSPRTMVVDVSVVGLRPNAGYYLIAYADTDENCIPDCKRWGKAQSGVSDMFRPPEASIVHRLNVEIDNILCQGAGPFTTSKLTIDLLDVITGATLIARRTFSATNTWCG